MRGSMNFCQGGPGPTARKQLCQRFLSFFCPQLLQFYSGLSMLYFKENYNFTRFRGGGGGGESNLFQGRGLGVQMQILETHRTFDFPGGGADPLSPLWIRTCDHLRGSGWGGGLVFTIH